MSLLNTLRFVLDHPLNRGRPVSSLLRFGAWQVRSRLTSAPIPVKFAGNTRLIVERGQTGATGNVYTGLHEFPEMAFVLHALRPDDLFVDVGANVGSYTIIAAGAVGARCVAFEPDPKTMLSLKRNVAANSLEDRVDLRQTVVGRSEGVARFTLGADTLNHVAQESDEGSGQVTMTTLDSALNGQSARVLKVDVEGYELEVIAGGSQTLADPHLLAAILETNGSTSRYGGSDRDIHEALTCCGFAPCSYDPFNRKLTAHTSFFTNGNTIYVKDFNEASARVKSAQSYDIAGRARI